MSNTVTLRFESEQAKNEFLAELNDGWGENYVMLDWDGKDDLFLVDTVDVTVFPETHSP